MKIFSILALLLLFGCNQPPEKITTGYDEYTFTIKFYSSVDEVNKFCDDDTGGCYKYFKSAPNKGVIHTIRSRCMLDHEIDHVLYGEFHKPGAACTERAN